MIGKGSWYPPSGHIASNSSITGGRSFHDVSLFAASSSDWKAAARSAAAAAAARATRAARAASAALLSASLSLDSLSDEDDDEGASRSMSTVTFGASPVGTP